MSAAPTSAISPGAIRAQREFARECVEFFAEAVQLFGVPKSVGQIYGVLYASPIPLSFSDIVDRLDISKGSASQGLQLLRALGAITETGPLKSSNGPLSSGYARARSVAYLPELSLRRLMSAILQERLAPLAATGSARLDRLRKLAEQDRVKNDFYRDRAKQLITWRRRLKTILPMFNALLGPTGKSNQVK